jgi:hypothetical protein
MALERFKAPALPIPTAEYDQRTMTDIIRALRLYFNQLDSLTPNQAQSYRADNFYGGEFDGTVMTADNVATSTLTATYSNVSSMMSEFIRSKGFLGGNFVGGTFMGTRFYGNEIAGNGNEITFPHGAFHQDGYTTLSTTIPNGSSTAAIVVASTSGFLSAGTLYIGSELINYTGKTATTFTGITRGRYSSSASSHTAGVYVSEAQAVPSATTALPLAMTTTDSSNQVTIDPLDNTKLVFAVAGYYNLQFSAQLLSFDNQIDDVTFWFRQNTVDIPNTAGYVSIPSIHGGVPGAAIVSWNLVIAINANDNVQLVMSSRTGNTVCSTYPPATAPVRPASPSIIFTATFTSGLSIPSNLPGYIKIAPISVTGFGQIGTVIVDATNTI